MDKIILVAAGVLAGLFIWVLLMFQKINSRLKNIQKTVGSLQGVAETMQANAEALRGAINFLDKDENSEETDALYVTLERYHQETYAELEKLKDSMESIKESIETLEDSHGERLDSE